ncbi:hypothetical protein MNBD_ACTINO02-1053 [hydrothermal vent metagenome]|uniref:Uncharacterized protein n=1 Tax=hydrothermal vent metagenome TaxID=652676 RepID=A0A3B0SNH0_9ZZZZ
MNKSDHAISTRQSIRTQPVGATEYGLAVVIGLGVLAQAMLAGRHIAFDSSITLHGIIGNGVFTLQAVLAGLLILRRTSTSLKVIAGFFVVLLVMQTGLGYVARSVDAAAAMHIPLGVALFGVAGLQIDRIRQASKV